MIITLKGANFSASNIGTLTTWNITKSLGAGATSSNNATSVTRGASYSTTITIAADYELGSAGVSVTMGGIDITSTASSISGNTISISISSVTGNVSIKVPTKNLTTGGESGGTDTPDVPVTPPTTSTFTLVQGYVSGATVDNTLKTRVRIDGLVSGAFSIECNNGYVIRAIQECTSTTPSGSDPNIVTSDQLKTSYSGGSAGKYYAITFCKTNASANISPTESIVKSFNGTIVAITSDTPSVDDTVAGTDVNYTLIQGAHVQNDSSIFSATNRITTPKAIKGKFTVTVNSGYAIRAVYEYTKESGDSHGTMVATTSEDRTTFTSTNDNKYYGVTFTYASPNAANNIAPTEDIVASWKYV